MNVVIGLETDHLMLAPIGPADLEYIVEVHRQSKSTTYDDTQNFQSRQEWKEFLLTLLEGGAVGWVLRHKPTEMNLGCLFLTIVVPGVGANFNPILDVRTVKDLSPTNGDGKRLKVMDEALQAVIPYAFDRFSLNRLGGIFASHNVPAILLCKRLGMKPEGVIRHGTSVHGKPMDLEIYGILREEMQKECPSP